jgi:hypothetical protein
VNITFDFGRRAGWLPKAGILCLLLVLVAPSGCKKSDSTPVSVAPSQESNSTPTAATPTAEPTAEPTNTLPPNQRPLAIPSNSANSGLTQLQLLNRALVGWEMKNHRHPLTFEEFASTASIQIPDPPAGQKYAFNQKGFIVLVNATQ